MVTTIEHDYAGCVCVTHGTPRNHIWTFVAGFSEGDPTSNGICPCDATRTIRIPPFVGNVTTSVSRESMNYGAGINMSNFTPVIHYGMERTVTPAAHVGVERTVTPAAHVAHNIIFHILPSNCQPQPPIVLKLGSVYIILCSMQTLQWS